MQVVFNNKNDPVQAITSKSSLTDHNRTPLLLEMCNRKSIFSYIKYTIKEVNLSHTFLN